MRVTGIIMECNPFHEGHAYILKKARSVTQADYCIAVMSGDFVQRGEPAVFDKYVRAKKVLHAGADLVLELPLYAACGSAEYFAQGGVRLLDRLGVVTDLCFGSESGDTAGLVRGARMLEALDPGKDMAAYARGEMNSMKDPAACARDRMISGEDPAACAGEAMDPGKAPAGGAGDAMDPLRFRRQLQESLRSGLSYPAARAAALQSAAPGAPWSRPASPNDLLALEYCRALLAAGSGIRVHAIPRIEAPSATRCRKSLLAKRKDPAPSPDGCTCKGPVPIVSSPEGGIVEAVPSPGSALPRGILDFPIGPDDFSSQLLYALRMEEDALARYADVSDALADRMQRILPRYTGFSQFAGLVKSRNVTYTRVSRALLHILLRMEKERLAQLREAGFALYARPLALRRSAAPLLSAIRRNAGIPFLSKLSASRTLLPPEAATLLAEEIRAEELYLLTLRGACLSAFPDSSASGGGAAPRAMQRRIVLL